MSTLTRKDFEISGKILKLAVSKLDVLTLMLASHIPESKQKPAIQLMDTLFLVGSAMSDLFINMTSEEFEKLEAMYNSIVVGGIDIEHEVDEATPDDDVAKEPEPEPEPEPAYAIGATAASRYFKDNVLEWMLLRLGVEPSKIENAVSKVYVYGLLGSNSVKVNTAIALAQEFRESPVLLENRITRFIKHCPVLQLPGVDKDQPLFPHMDELGMTYFHVRPFDACKDMGED